MSVFHSFSLYWFTSMKQKIDKNPCPPGAYISVAKTNHKCVNKQMIENIMVRSAVGERIE